MFLSKRRNFSVPKRMVAVPIVAKVIVALASFFFLGAFPAYAQATPMDVALVSCSPNFSITKDNTFTTKSGDIVTFKCTLTNKGTASTTVLLSGARTKENATDSTSATSVSFSVIVPPRGTVKADVPFISLFENGTYHYVITLKNLSDGKSFGSPLTFTSMLNAPTIRIVSATLDKQAYALGDTVSLAVTVAPSVPGIKGEAATPFFLDVAVKWKDGKACSYPVSGRSITSTRESVDFLLSTSTLPSNCSATTLGVTLRGKDGFPQDSRDIPFTVRGLGLFSSSSSTRLMLALLVIVSLAALAWTLRALRLRRSRNTTL